MTKGFAIPLDFDFFKHLVYPFGLQEDLTITIEFNSTKEVILCTGDSNAIYKMLEAYIREMSILYTKVTSTHYQAISKKDIVWIIDLNNLSAGSLRGLLLLFFDKHDDFANKNEEFYNPSIMKSLVTINVMAHQLYTGGLRATDIYSELKRYFYKENSNKNNEEFLSTKFGLWIDTRSSIDNTLHGNGRTIDKGMVLQMEKAYEAGGDLMCYVFSLEDAVVHISVTDPTSILTIEK